MAQVQKSISAAMEQLLAAKKEIREQISKLPDNPNITRLSDSPRCFVTSFKDLGDIWCPYYHDFKWQYEQIAAKMETLLDTPKEALRIINSMLDAERIQPVGEKRDYRLHPTVIDNVRNIINGE